MAVFKKQYSFVLQNETLPEEEVEKWRVQESAILSAAQEVRLVWGVVPDGSAAWIRIVRYELGPNGLTDAKRYILSTSGWREYQSGEGFDAETDLYRIPANDMMELGRAIMAMMEPDEERE